MTLRDNGDGTVTWSGNVSFTVPVADDTGVVLISQPSDAKRHLGRPKLDIIDEIDALVDEQMASYDQRSGYDYNVNQETCPHCGRHWHGLRVTERIARMYDYGTMDPAYLVAEDDSPTVCEGSEFIGPQIGGKPGWGVGASAWSVTIGQFTHAMGEATIQIIPSVERFTYGIERAAASLSEAFSWPQIHMPRPLVPWVIWHEPPTPTQPPRALVPHERELPVEFGPDNWLFEIRRDYIPQGQQFPAVQWWPLPPNVQAVQDLWEEFTAPNYPLPDRPGFDFDAIPVRGRLTAGPELAPLGRRS